MSRGPRRLKDDPDFQWETGCDLGDESVLTQDYDLSSMKARLLERLPEVGDGVPAIRPRQVGRWWVAGITGVTLTLTAFWLGTQFATGDAPLGTPVDAFVPTAPPDDVVERPTETVEPALPPESADEARPPATAPDGPGLTAPPAAAPPATTEPAGRPTKTRPTAPPIAPPRIDDPAPVDADDGVALVEPTPATNIRVESALARELTFYEPASQALEEGESAAAARAFEAYLEAFPTGTLRPEAELGLLWALHDEGDAARTERWAARLQDRPAHTAHRDDIRELRAQALVRLGRCDEALSTVEGLPSRAIGPIRRACRKR